MNHLIRRLDTWLVAHPIVRKPLNTFWQAFSATFLLGLGGVIDAAVNQNLAAAKAALLALIVASVAAALSAMKTYLVELAKSSS